MRQVGYTKTKNLKKQKVGCRLGDLPKINTKTKIKSGSFEEKENMHQTYNIHTPVLLDAVLRTLAPQEGESYLDLTAGYGGHAGAILEQTGSSEQAVLVDRDSTAIGHLRSFASKGAQIMHNDFLAASQELVEQERQFDVILADLGVSSLHLDEASRGFAFMKDGPLDMRMDQSTGMTAAELVNSYDEDALAQILRTYGEEPQAKRIAHAIVASRPHETTAGLANAIEAVVPRRGKTHPATRAFQAIRIAVNDELGQVEKALPLWLKLLKPGGRLGVISFHSLEDRIVKQAFASVSGNRYDAAYTSLTKRPVVADDAEIAFNPRARSAKLRAVAKINTERG